MQTLKAIVGTLLALGLIALAGAYSGLVNVAASYPHAAVTQWLLHAAMARSAKYHARDVPRPPAALKQMEGQGAEQYREMCAQCHGAPGVEPDEIGKGLTPSAPDLVNNASDWTSQELFWIIKNGVRFTGMPAWGPTHTDDQLWALTAFVLALPGLTPQRYRELAGGNPPHLHHDGEGAGSSHHTHED
jgi:mono/diheme cytochrome c family protein